MSEKKLFKLKYFDIWQSAKVFKVGTDAFVLGSWVETIPPPRTILDIGTGTGILSLMMAQKFPEASITAIDSNIIAVELAKLNFEQAPFGSRIRAIQADFEHFESAQKFDLIISNPPYFVDALLADSEVLSYAKHVNSSGVKALFACVQRLMTVDGAAVLIHPYNPIFQEIASQHGLHVQKQLRVFGVVQKLVRVCNLYGFEKCETQIENLVIRDSQGNYTGEYKSLTREFHGVKL